MLRVFKQLLLQEIVVSSANSINDSNLLLFSMSFIYSRKRIGPRIDPKDKDKDNFNLPLISVIYTGCLYNINIID